MARLPAKWLETTALVAGLLLLGVTLQKIGLAGLLRDLSVIGWGLAVIGHLEWFLYAAAVGSWLFAGGLVLYRLAWRARQAIAPGGPPGAAAGPHRATSAPTGQDA